MFKLDVQHLSLMVIFTQKERRTERHTQMVKINIRCYIISKTSNFKKYYSEISIFFSVNGIHEKEVLILGAMLSLLFSH